VVSLRIVAEFQVGDTMTARRRPRGAPQPGALDVAVCSATQGLRHISDNDRRPTNQRYPRRRRTFRDVVQTGGVTYFVLVGGWPGSGRTTLARALATEMEMPYLSKEETKEALMDALGAPTTVEESRKLGSAAVHAVLTVARGCPGAVIDST